MQKDINKIPKGPQPNVAFYLGLNKDPTYRMFITDFQKRREDYQFLESKHAYIQWLFPNHYHSKFNYNSYTLSPSQAIEFRTNPKIATNMIFSYQLIMNFMGIKLNSIKTGQLSLISQQRLKNVLIKNTHNHLRIMRVIACLSTVGFRSYGKKLIQFLENTVQTKKFNCVKNVFTSKWKIYEQDNKAKQMCFLSDITLLNLENQIFQDENQLNKIQNHINQMRLLTQKKK